LWRERGMAVCGAKRILAASIASLDASLGRGSITGKFLDEKRRAVVRVVFLKVDWKNMVQTAFKRFMN
jgi:hypothetical protein